MLELEKHTAISILPEGRSGKADLKAAEYLSFTLSGGNVGTLNYKDSAGEHKRLRGSAVASRGLYAILLQHDRIAELPAEAIIEQPKRRRTSATAEPSDADEPAPKKRKVLRMEGVQRRSGDHLAEETCSQLAGHEAWRGPMDGTGLSKGGAQYITFKLGKAASKGLGKQVYKRLKKRHFARCTHCSAIFPNLQSAKRHTCGQEEDAPAVSRRTSAGGDPALLPGGHLLRLEGPVPDEEASQEGAESSGVETSEARSGDSQASQIGTVMSRSGVPA
ncbi:hypothetical protein COCOBI_19-2020 [Coccomyxa sp. Obi]|nr:hypothetical protein COCOBI_19-2020 [Coccomyxa sp. Obi]